MTATAKTLSVRLAEIQDAQRRISSDIIRTPLVLSDSASARAGVPVYLKLENLQRTGAFKVRGALSMVTSLTPERGSCGLVCASTGNHALGAAYAASARQLPCMVVLPENPNPYKVSLLEKLGAEVILCGTTSDERQAKAEELAREYGYTLLHPFADPALIAGQGTVGLEILEDLPEVEEVYVPVGGGGLISGVAVAIKEQRPAARIFGVEPEHANAVWTALQAEKPVQLPRLNTVAEGLAAWATEELNLSIIRRYVERILLVPDRTIVEATWFLLERANLLVEPSGAASLAGLWANSERRGKAVAVLSGGNVTVQQIEEYRRALRV